MLVFDKAGEYLKEEDCGEAEGTQLQSVCFRRQGFFKSSWPLPHAPGCDSFLSESLVNVDSINFDLRLWTND